MIVFRVLSLVLAGAALRKQKKQECRKRWLKKKKQDPGKATNSLLTQQAVSEGM